MVCQSTRLDTGGKYVLAPVESSLCGESHLQNSGRNSLGSHCAGIIIDICAMNPWNTSSGLSNLPPPHRCKGKAQFEFQFSDSKINHYVVY